ncbi:MAG: pyrroline-5-carboxylate reductase [Bifidobacteriaceae bacterium]|jgi:pyrroline-5-carboxylate reductase|nr:pyrroline-5-carboxylate reductase [Bifidobacteriaceae bacterium]
MTHQTRDKQLGFIGAGNMASAIIRGLIDAGVVDGQQIVVADPNQAATQLLASQFNVVVADSNEQVAQTAQTVILAVKPQVIRMVASLIADHLAGALVVSIAAGTSLADLESILGAVALVRLMPNVALQVGQGITAVVGNGQASAEQVAQVRRLFDVLGETVELPESQFAAFAAVAGASPAWTFYYINALAMGGVATGLPKALALTAATAAVRGSAALLASGQTHPSQWIDRVCSPGGTTIAGLAVLEERAVAGAVIQAVRACVQRDQQISDQA